MTFLQIVFSVIISILTIIAAWYAIKKTRASISTEIVKQVMELSKLQKGLIDEQNERITELERERDERDERELGLTRYIEYLLAGVRVLIGQLCALKEMPEFDVISFADFLAGNIG